jgi:hypothetical protein
MVFVGGFTLQWLSHFLHLTTMTIELELEELNTPTQTPEEQELKELETRIQFLEQERINLRVAPVIFDKLLRCAELAGLSIEDYAVGVLVSNLETAIGKPTISSPSNLSGVITQKVRGYTGSVQRG